jgi:2-oxoglutarate ferredoxin oxidoreductase subunit delta
MLAYGSAQSVAQFAMNRVDVYKGWCKKCGICIAFCPRKVLSVGDDGFPTASNPEACTGCRWCEFRCPDFAIVVTTDEHAEDSGN